MFDSKWIELKEEHLKMICGGAQPDTGEEGGFAFAQPEPGNEEGGN